MEINPDFALGYSNLGKILNACGKLEEGELEKNKGINLSFIQNIDAKNKEECLKNLSLSKSQFKQDLFVLSELNFKKNGFFVEFGSYDGLTGSNSYILEKYFNWNGILAEPCISCYEQLKENRSVIIETKCVWKISGEEIIFNEPFSHKQNSTIDSISDNRKNIYKEGNRYKVKTISLLDLLEKNNAPRFIDYLSIDTEGSEFEILNVFDFKKYKFNVITCEHNFTPMREKIYNLLTSKGYQRKLTNISRVDDWYVLNE
ncbi:methyltransferase [Prochlorococcus marinus XMU1408]|uniref:Methyltransferase n=1 Tax=Prochlorococcus marinus XMU1408 TaxID=2213228 RepID=A0A318R278_PROMR|nr:methyltransferase [Prochlorococcus marinus XMU1408]